WQSLLLETFVDQSGNPIQGVPEFISPEWGNVLPFALLQEDMVIKVRDDDIYKVYYDVGDPPYLDTLNQSQLDSAFKKAFSMVSVWSSHLDRKDGVIWDISPKSIGNVINYPNSIAEYSSFYNYFDGGDNGNGYQLNPITGVQYEEQLVPRGDYTRVLAEFWADGPDSETPPGHWFVILNQVNDSELLEKKFEGEGDILDDLEWDIKSYFTLGGAMHDAAITAWGIKGYYDYIRPISVIRYLSDQGQSTYIDSLNYSINGINLIDNYIDLVYVDDPLVGENLENLGKIKLFTWSGHTSQGSLGESGSGWILAENWWPYQRPTFVTPPFAGYVSGHSTYSKAAAEVLSKITGSSFFPGGMGEFHINKNEFLVFENGPSIDMILQWAKYEDAADQCSLSRIWGGIHPYIDDIPGRMIGKEIGNNAFNLAKTYFQRNDIINNIENYPNDYVIYPNPTRNDSFINLINESSKAISYIEMYDLNGVKQNISIIDGLQRNYRINISNVSSGIYIIYLIFSDGSNKSTKLVIRK
ncbi:MAG: T9SS type A sorting domain-containing protein, partial [Marinoscillum sp.]